jgi:uncharacterized phage protein gp47/JayE
MSYSLKIVKPDGVNSSTSTNYSTDKEEVFIHGLVEGYTEITVSFLDEVFTSVGQEADIIINNDGSWVFPDPNTSEGIDLNQGDNSFLITATDGSDTTSLTLIVISSLDSNTAKPQPPLNIKAERADDNVVLSWVHTDSEISSYNVYASTVSGGGDGYRQINKIPIDPITYGFKSEKATSLVDFSSDIEAIKEDPNVLTIKALQNTSESDVGSQEIAENVSRLRVATNVSAIELETKVSFRHNRTSPNSASTIDIGEFASLNTDTPLYYVITAVKVVDNQSVESAFSIEVGSAPINLQLVNTTLPNVTDSQLTESMISAIYDADPTAAVQAGSAIRDLFIDPVVSEVSRIRVLLDFCYKATNFVSLNDIDDPTGLGESIFVSNSSYKQLLKEAYFLDTDTQVQNLIDICFDRLASNLGISRLSGQVARGEATFFSRSLPTFDLIVPIGQIISSGGVRFRTLQPGTITVSEAPNFYNPITRRYEITLPIQADTAGLSGNVTSGQITTGAPLGLSVVNNAPTFGGSTRETNQELMTRAMTYISSVDVGTRAGYERVARESAGVEGFEVIDADNPYMIRDNDLGGKVDIWVRGELLSRITDVYAPSYKSRKDSRFIPILSEGAYKFQASDATTENPLFQMIDRTGTFGLKNQTNGEFFDLTGAVISEGKILTLNADIPQPTYRMTDIILGDYRTDVTNKVVLDRQPVRQVISVRKADGTDLNYTFYKTEDPLMQGQSSKAQDYIIIDNDGLEKIISITAEQQTLNELYAETLLNRGIDITTIVVKDSNGNIFLSPLTSTTPDYIIEVDNDLTTIKRTTTSAITSGQNVFVDYEYLENITVTYQTNLVVSNLQLEVDEQKHMGADVLIKEVTPVRVNVKGLVYLEQGTSATSVDSTIKASLFNLITQTTLGGSLYPSDFIREIDSVRGVSYVSVPLTELSLTDGDQILREKLNPTVPIEITEFTSSSHKVWLMDVQLDHVPQTSGGSNARVFLNGKEIETLSEGQRETPTNWNGEKGSIVGLEKAYISNNGVLTEIPNSARKLMLSLPLGETPLDYEIEVNYTCGNGTGVVGEIKLNNFSYFQVGDLSFTYEEERR